MLNDDAPPKKIEADKDYRFAYPFARGGGLCCLFLALSILALCYTYYRSEIFHQGRLAEEYFKHYIISFAGICVWGGVLRLRAAWQANIITVTIVLLFALYLAEAGLILFSGIYADISSINSENNLKRIVKAKSLGSEFDSRTRFQVVTDLRNEGVDAVVSFPAWSWKKMGEETTLFTLSGISKQTTVLRNENGEYLIYPSDRYGFNNPDEVWDAPETEWLLTGDSFTQGVATPPDENIAGQLQAI